MKTGRELVIFNEIENEEFSDKENMGAIGMKESRWIIYNQGEYLEFAECENCGHERNPAYSVHHVPGKEHKAETIYPMYCPGCQAVMIGRIKAEEVE